MRIKPPGGPEDRFQRVDRTEKKQKKQDVQPSKPSALNQTSGKEVPQSRLEARAPYLIKALQAAAEDMKAGKMKTIQDVTRKLVRTVLVEQFGEGIRQERGYEAMEAALRDAIAREPILRRKIREMLERFS